MTGRVLHLMRECLQMRRDAQRMNELVNRILERHPTVHIPQHLQAAYRRARQRCMDLIGMAQDEAQEFTCEEVQRRYGQFDRYADEENARYMRLEMAMVEFTDAGKAVVHWASTRLR